MLSAPLLLLFLQYESLSFNVHKPDLARGGDADPILGLLNWIVPFYEGAPEGAPRGWFGVTVAIAALVAISGRTETRRLHAWYFLAMGLFLLVKIYDFGVLDWFGQLPVAKLVVFPWFAPPVVGFAFAVLAGIAVQVLLNFDLGLRRFLTLLGLVAIPLVVVALTSDDSRVLTSDHVRVGIRTAFFAVLAVTVVVISGWLGRSWGAWLLAGLVVAELFLLAPFDIYARRADPYVAPAWIADVRAAQGDDPRARVFALDGKLYPNTAAAFGLQDIRVLDALFVNRYWRYVKTFVQPVRDRFTGTERPPAVLRGNPMFNALGVRAIVSERPLGETPEFRQIGGDSGTRVYEATNAFPRAWIAHTIHVVDSEDDAFAFLRARAQRKGGVYVVDRFNPLREAVVERPGSEDEELGALAGRGRCAAETEDSVTIDEYSGNSVSLEVSAACPGLLVLPDTYFPGWTATVDGHDATVLPTDGAFRGIAVPAGASHVEFQYAPRAFSLGVLIAVAGVVGAIVIGSVCWVIPRRRPPRSMAAPGGAPLNPDA
jgi:hypothetical protein